MMKIYNIYVYYPQKKVKKLNIRYKKLTLQNTEHKNHLISSSRQIDAFDLFIKIHFVHCIYFLWLDFFQYYFQVCHRRSVDLQFHPRWLQYCLALKRMIAYIFLKKIVMIRIQYGPLLQLYVCQALKFVCIKICCFTVNRSFKNALSDLRQFLATESPLKMIKNTCYFTPKPPFTLKIFKFLSWNFGHGAERVD